MTLLSQCNAFMQKTGIGYSICGGQAIDLFLGRKTRPHKDLDVAVYWEDRDVLVQYMLNEGWDVYEPCGTAYLHKINSVAEQKRIKTNIWCVRPWNPHYRFTEHEKDMFAVDFDNTEQAALDFIEFLFNTTKDGYFLYAKNHDIKMRLDEAICRAEGVPYLAPGMVLLYKSTAAEDLVYQLDFENASKEMREEQLEWLKHALAIMYPEGHRWLEC